LFTVNEMVNKLEILDKQKFLEIVKVISWLDDKRWDLPENYNFINYFRDDLTNSEKVLTHWICYITDRRIPFEIIWDNGGFVFSELVFNFSRKNISVPELLDKFYEEYKDKKNETKFRFKSLTLKNNKPIFFASRYITTDIKNIRQTLEILEKEYDRSIIKFILSFIERFEDKEDLLIRIASALYLLTYKEDYSVDKIIEILEDDAKFEKKVTTFKKTSTHNKKRLWCCVRDYKKGLFFKIFTDAVKEVLNANKSQKIINIWKKLPMEQIELPGDVWNNNLIFRERLFKGVLNLDNLPKNWQMPKIIREAYEQIKDKIKEKGIKFYPEQFDITFDFVPRMCSKKLCSVCPFGKNGSEQICIPNKEKFCPVALVACGYITKCIGKENCIIYSNIGKGVCTTLEGR